MNPVGNPTADAVGRLLDHLEPRVVALRSILATPDARGDVARVAALGLGTRVAVTDDLG